MNQFTTLAASALALAFVAPTVAQDIRVFGGNGQTRAAATKLLFDQERCLAIVSIQYGQPQWKDEYSEMVKAKSTNFRLGKDFWTTLHTSVDLDIGGERMPAGSYYLGLHANAEGKMQLAAFDAKGSDQAEQYPWTVDSWKINWVAPLTHSKVDNSESKLQINLHHKDGDAPTDLTFQIHWGNHTLSAPVKLHIKGAKDATDAAGKKAGEKSGGAGNDKAPAVRRR